MWFWILKPNYQANLEVWLYGFWTLIFGGKTKFSSFADCDVFLTTTLTTTTTLRTTPWTTPTMKMEDYVENWRKKFERRWDFQSHFDRTSNSFTANIWSIQVLSNPSYLGTSIKVFHDNSAFPFKTEHWFKWDKLS